MSTLIPISLFVSIECKRFLISRWMECDTDIYSLIRDQPTKVANSGATTDLGQISYLFSDKTGTLTCNQMKFKSMAIGYQTFGDVNRETTLRFESNEFDEYVKGKKTKQVNKLLTSTNFMVTQMIEDQRALIFEFMKALTLCHEVVTEQKDLSSQVRYVGPSPDEIALVEAAADVGFILSISEEDKIELNFTNGMMECDSYYSDEEQKAPAMVEGVELELDFELNRNGVHYGPGVH